MQYFIDHRTPPILHFSKLCERFLFKKLLTPVQKGLNQARRFRRKNSLYMYGINVCIRPPNCFSLFGFEREKIEFFEIHSKLGPIQGLALYPYEMQKVSFTEENVQGPARNQ